MAVYTRLLIVVNTKDEAAAINAELDRSEIYYDEYAIPYGTHAIGFRFEAIEMRYDGVRNSEWEHYLAQGLRYDLRRGFDN